MKKLTKIYFMVLREYSIQLKHTSSYQEFRSIARIMWEFNRKNWYENIISDNTFDNVRKYVHKIWADRMLNDFESEV